MLEDLKVGDKCKSCLRGWGTIIRKYNHYQIAIIKFKNNTWKRFHFNGKSSNEDMYPEIIETEYKLWKPKGGLFIIHSDGQIKKTNKVDNKWNEEGRAYPSKREAEVAYHFIRKYQRYISWLIEHDYLNNKGIYEIQNDIIKPRVRYKLADKLSKEINDNKVKF